MRTLVLTVFLAIVVNLSGCSHAPKTPPDCHPIKLNSVQDCQASTLCYRNMCFVTFDDGASSGFMCDAYTGTMRQFCELNPKKPVSFSTTAKPDPNATPAPSPAPAVTTPLPLIAAPAPSPSP